MAKYLLLALNGPHEGEGKEDAYNRWYDEIHIPDLEAIPGVRSARRYKTIMSRRISFPYVAAYEIEVDDLDAFMKDLETKPRPYSPAMNRDTSAMVLAVAIPRADE